MPADEMTKTRQPAKLSDLTDGNKYYTLWPSDRNLTWTAMKPTVVRGVDILPDGRLDNTNQLFVVMTVERRHTSSTGFSYTRDEQELVPAAELGLDPNVETNTRTYELLAV